MLCSFVVLYLLIVLPEPGLGKQPNILFILADDFGYNDVSWNNEDVFTPNLEKLGREGVILDTYYASTRCSPSRGALLTGLYPHRLGIQRGNIGTFRPTGLVTDFKTFPEILQAAGYTTHLVGRWHLGYCHPSYLPTRRGFTTFFGQFSQQTDHYSRIYLENEEIGEGYDLRRGENISYEGAGKYSTHLWRDEAQSLIEGWNSSNSTPWFLQVSFTAAGAPYQVPESYVKRYKKRRFRNLSEEDTIRYGMISAVDSAVGDIVKTLKQRNMFENTVLVFSSDNGVGGDVGNLPFRGSRGTLWEGGVRVPALVSSPLLNLDEGYTTRSMVHITDWFPTLLKLAGVSSDVQTDGFNIWEALQQREEFSRNSLVYSLDQDDKSGHLQHGIREKNIKFVWGNPDKFEVNKRFKKDVYHLFDLEKDPTETENLASQYPELVEKMKEKVKTLVKDVKPAFQPNRYSLGYPKYHDGVISTGWCETDWWKILWRSLN
ncbi:arylsulfatase B [Eurytemora carolleeae]|uniref:arylsulfatase B n=1 Tax=Eurytemora carolleeae TaxID=1294199 RepID=UPI000C7617EB|nr:arylsulfatase B [Eurytemora carolleeae]|eukprot:XP_023320888.1 arylsulfatase B-like [Eurytemora affinis]